jgi:hypothetical protein
MNTNPDFDFQLGRRIRLRGWGLQGIAALVLLLSSAIAVTWNAPVQSAFQWVVSHLIATPKTLYDSAASNSVKVLIPNKLAPSPPSDARIQPG